MAWDAVTNWWNSQDQGTKLAIIAVVATVAIVATAGLAAPAVLPLVAAGIAIGASSSVASYAVSAVASGKPITASGLFKSASVGAFFGAVTFGTFGTVASAAAGAGLGTLGSFALGALASMGVSTAASAAFTAAGGDTNGAGGPPDLSSQTNALTETFESSAQNHPECQANMPMIRTLLVGGAFLVHFSGLVHVAAEDAGSEYGQIAAWGMFGAGLTAIGAGAYVGYQSCVA